MRVLENSGFDVALLQGAFLPENSSQHSQFWQK